MLTLPQQALGLRSRFPSGTTSIKDRSLRWRCELRPTTVSPEYTVTLGYRVGGHPKVFVVDPPLDPGDGRKLPHVYDKDQLCLYSDGEWNGSMPIAETIVPWVAEWLLFYEIWLITDVWEGSGGDESSGAKPWLEPPNPGA